mgnify:CR=1 FL=1
MPKTCARRESFERASMCSHNRLDKCSTLNTRLLMELDDSSRSNLVLLDDSSRSNLVLLDDC